MLDWWKYLLGPMQGVRCNDETFWRLRVIVCRAKGHPGGVVFYNPSGWEPDMHCLNCGDDLG